MASLIAPRVRLRLYLRMVAGAAMLGIAFGYYLQLSGRLEMSPFLVFAFAVRGLIVGALIWAFELYWVLGPDGSRLKNLASVTRFGARIVVYLILGEVGYWIGEAIFAPANIADLFFTAGGKNQSP